jgi:hypothetical protein
MKTHVPAKILSFQEVQIDHTTCHTKIKPNRTRRLTPKQKKLSITYIILLGDTNSIPTHLSRVLETLRHLFDHKSKNKIKNPNNFEYKILAHI